MLPELFLDRMQNLLGEDYEEFLSGFAKEKYQALRLNALKVHSGNRTAAEIIAGEVDLSEVKFEMRDFPAHLTKVPWAENGYYYESGDQPGKHPYHEAGVYYIQEPSAMAPVTLLEVKPGERILDLCAAPGGKSTQIAAALQGEGLLVCNEIHPARAKILSENVERMGIRNACVTNETPQRLSQIFVEYFDRILVDAPCSGEGMFRKNEVACEEWSPENVQLCADRQDEILDCAAKMLRPGGRLVYSTCTFAPQENEGSISRFMASHPEFEIVAIDKKSIFGEAIDTGDVASLDGRPEWVEPLESNRKNDLRGTLRLWPHLLKGEGHYAAVLQKAGDVPKDYVPMAAGGVEKGIGLKELGEYPEFVKENLVNEPGCDIERKYLKFGDNIYLVPGDMPSLKGMKVLRPGLHVGTLKKNRFEPSHALALALAPAEAAHVWNLSSKEATVSAYLNGQTLPAEGEKGWYLICVDGFSLGWGKLAGGMMKNHYPKGLRKNM